MWRNVEAGCVLVQYLLPVLKTHADSSLYTHVSSPRNSGDSSGLHPSESLAVCVRALVQDVCGAVLEVDRPAVRMAVQLVCLLLLEIPIGNIDAAYLIISYG
jgi:hypothetical protein